jgi:hypothetical protein
MTLAVEETPGLQFPHNYFAAWMITPLPGPGIRPVDNLDRHVQLAGELGAFARRIVRPSIPRTRQE